MTTPNADELTPAEAFRRGVLASRAERWREALGLLTRVAQRAEARGNLPGLFYSCLGVAMARVEGRRHEGMELCRYAVQVQPDEPDNHYHLALVYLMVGRRKPAVNEIFRGLELAPENPRLGALQRRLGIRRPPVVPFLGRANPVNVVLGQVRHRLLVQAEERRLLREEEALEAAEEAAETP